MDCDRARELIPAAELNELEEPQRGELIAHLEHCAGCRQLSAETRRAVALLGEAPTTLAPRGLSKKLITRGRADLAAARRRRRIVLFAASLAAASLLAVGVWLLSGPGSEEPCGCWRYVAGGTGNCRHADSSLHGLPDRILWETPVNGTAGAYKLLAWKRLILVGAHPRRRTHRGGGRLLAFDSVSGEMRWQRDFPAGDFYKAKGFPDRCILDGILYVTDKSSCHVLELNSGRQLRRLEPPDDALGWSYLTAEGDRLYGLSRDGRTLFCVAALTGRQVWSRSLGGRAFVPALSAGRLVVATASGELAAFRATDGLELWRKPGAPPGRSTVHACAGNLLVLGESDEVAAFDPRNGKRQWKRTIKGAFASGAAIGENNAYLLAGTLAVSLRDGSTRWQRSEADNGLCSAPTLTGEQILATAGGELGSLSVFASDGALAGQLAGAARRACDGAIVAGGRIYAVGSGRLRAVACRPRG
jgi:outer membrane protein assembly factor BamB